MSKHKKYIPRVSGMFTFPRKKIFCFSKKTPSSKEIMGKSYTLPSYLWSRRNDFFHNKKIKNKNVGGPFHGVKGEQQKEVCIWWWLK